MNYRFLTWGKWIWVTAVVVATAVFVSRNSVELASQLMAIPRVELLKSLGLLVLGRVGLVELARRSVVREDWAPSFWEMFVIVGVTHFGKYLPGGIWHFVGRIGHYRAQGMSLEQASRGILVENIWLTMSAGFVGLIFSIPFFLGNQFSRDSLVVSGVFVLFLWAFANGGIDRLHRPRATGRVRWTSRILLLQISVWVLLGLSFSMLFPEPGSMSVQIGAAGAFCLAWLGGFLAVFAPGGIGVREMIITVLLVGFISQDQAVALALTHRALWLVVEILFGVTALTISLLPKEHSVWSMPTRGPSAGAMNDSLDS